MKPLLPSLSQPLWRSTELAQALAGEATSAFNCTTISIDSRTIDPGAGFVAIRGPRHDGHDHLAEVAAKGAAGAIVMDHSSVQIPQIKVADTNQALWRLATKARARFNGKVIGITGSVGKTSCKQLLATLLPAYGNCYTAPGNYNNLIGVPLSLVNCPEAAKFAIFELGMNQPGEIDQLATLVRPHLGIITNIGRAHIGNFRDQTALVAAKLELVDRIAAGGTLILAVADRTIQARVRKQARQKAIQVITVAGTADADADADLRYSVTELHPKHTLVSVVMAWQPGKLQLQIPAFGSHWGLLAAIAMATLQGLRLHPVPAQNRLSQLTVPSGRGVWQQLSLSTRAKGEPSSATITVLDASYNAAPESMIALIHDFAKLNASTAISQRKILILGDMLELGPQAGSIHMEVGKLLSKFHFAAVFLCGNHMGNLLPLLRENGVNVAHANRVEELMPAITAFVSDGDVVAIKGSLAVNLHKILTMFA